MKLILFIVITIIILPILIFAWHLIPPEVLLPRLETTLVYQGAVSGQYSDSIELKALLSEEHTQNPISGKEVEFILEEQRISAVTDVKGVATAALVLNQAASAYSLLTIWAGDDAFHGSSDSDSFEILREDIVLTYTGPLSGEEDSYVTLSAQLSEKDGTIGNLQGKTIIFEVGGFSDRATTDSDGKASIDLRLDISPGKYTLISKFEGNAFYLSSSDSDSFEVVAIPGNGNGNGCFIATVLYGSLAWETEMLRQFRDRYLLTNFLGRLLVSEYEQHGLFLANLVSENQKLKNIIRKSLEPIIRTTALLVYLAY